jgi:RHS repeat-associated protein
VPVPWPGWNTRAWNEEAAKPNTTGDENYWFGSLAVGMRDASGQLYMRNRYYDPKTNQFTQPDPIGLAGGLNSYGFAEGDPVSYTDPYGLSICWPIWKPRCRELIQQAIETAQASAEAIVNQLEENIRTRLERTAECWEDPLCFAMSFSGAGTTRVGSAGATRNGFLRDFATRGTHNWSAVMASERDARNLARRMLGRNPVQVEPNKWRSRDGRWQYRARPGDVRERHIHLEQLNPETGEVIQNVHLRWNE